MSRITALLSTVLIAFVVGACDKSNPSGPSSATGNVTIAGNVTSPVPSGLRVSVNGTSNSALVDGNGHFTLNNVAAGAADLRFTATGVTGSIVLSNLQSGDSVTIGVSIAGSLVVLDSTRRVNGVNEEIDGRIESLAASSLVVAGRSIATDTGTQFVVSGQQVSFSALSVGMRVVVRGQASGGSLRATIIDIQGALPLPGQTIEGMMTNFSGTRASFQLTADGKSIVGDAATEFANGSLYSELGNGISIQVTAVPRDASSFYASRIVVVSPAIAFTGRIITKAGSAPELVIVVTGRTVKMGPATALLRKGEPQNASNQGTISVGQTVEVAGRILQDTSMIASSVNILSDSAGGSFAMEGTITGKSGPCPQLQLTVSSYEITTFTTTTFEPTCGALAVGDRVEVIGTVQADLSVWATSVKKR